MIMAIDPGPVQSAYVLVYGKDDMRPISFNKLDNDTLMSRIYSCCTCGCKEVVIERFACYGMPVGEESLETVHWAGRFYQVSTELEVSVSRIYRRDVKIHICHNGRAKDSNVRQALIDRFGQVGTKANKGWFYGFAGDCWQAYALAVAFAEAKED